jgi:hypothetical protein
LPSPTATPTATATQPATATWTPTATAAPGACQQLIVNGDFEATAGWIMPSTAYPAAYSTARARSGRRSLRAGIDAPPDRYSFSDGYQLVTIPASAASATLRAWWFPRSAEGSLATSQADAAPPIALIQSLIDGTLPQGALASDRQYLLILDSRGAILATLLWTRSNDQAWLPLTFDLTAYRGRTIQVRFGVYNDGNGLPSSLYLDDVSLDACPPNPASPTPTRSEIPIRGVQPWPTLSKVVLPMLLASAPSDNPQ